MTKVTFETATLADSLTKASRVAPSKGTAFDKAAGIVIEITPLSPSPVVVKSTNLDIFYMEWVDVVSVSGENTAWRVPAHLLASVVGSLPIGSGKNVTFENKASGNQQVLHMESGKTKAKFNLLDVSYYPEWSAFNPDDLIPAPDLGGRLTQVEWAASKTVTGDPLSGIYLDGESAVSTDKYRLARVPLKITLDKPVTVPAGMLSLVLKTSGDPAIGIDGTQLLVMPDEHTQIRTILLAADYPNVQKVMRRDYPNQIHLKKTEFLEVIQRSLNFVGAERFPTLRVYIGQQEIAVMMQNQEIGLLGDVVDVPKQAKHSRLELKFTPKNLVDALTNAPSENVTLGYNADKPEGTFYIDGGSGYEAWVMPRRDMSS